MSVIDIKPDAQGKVRDLYDLGDKLLLVASDRISAFDYILEDEIPYKGQVLTQLSCFWFDLLSDVVDNHLISADVADLPEQFKPYADKLAGRFMLVKKANMFPVECIVRGYLTGSGLKDYQKTGAVCGIQLPEGLVNSSKLPETIFTPSTKAEIGDHDENISFEPTRLAKSSPASTSSLCATGSMPTGTALATRRVCPKISSRRPAKSTFRLTRRSRARPL